ncbi:MAG: prepilin-type N-terminal cleavage/methylation domain-containing protein [Campylobacteraceae bacterium]|jgi:prepilin-type N-terminal cleavage/methylation domain-containing protein|nr:prepilin-type N-terminal cleavage/methylation domain-containing protein [Campylobacteraceae bacterium]
MRAFTLIELVITIVIVGIVSLSFPLIMTQTGNNIVVATQQEAVLAAKTYIGTILSYPWDGNTYAVGGGFVGGMILETNSALASMASDSEFDRILGTNLRPGNIYGNDRRRLMDSIDVNRFPTPATAFGIIGDPGDIDDFNGRIQNLNINAADMDYIFQLSLTPTILYVDDETDYTDTDVDFEFDTGDAGGITNIKMISMNVIGAADAPDIDITLRAYSSNIGEIELLKRTRGSW